MTIFSLFEMQILEPSKEIETPQTEISFLGFHRP